MYKTLNLLLAAIMLLSGASVAYAGGGSTGLFHSPKGFGLVFEWECSPAIYNSYLLYADCFPMLAGDSTVPGIKLDFSHNKMFCLSETPERRICLIAGGGFGAGYVQDYDMQKYSLCPVLLGRTGLRAMYSKGLRLELAWQLELGLSVRRNTKGDYLSTLYKAGIYRAFLPGLKISYAF